MNYHGERLRWAHRRTHTANVVFGEVLYDLNGVCGPRLQKDFELVVLHSGSCRVLLNGTACELEPGALYLFHPGGREHFQFASDTESHHSFCSVKPRFMPAHLRRQLAKAPFSAPCSEVFRLLLTLVAKLRAPHNRVTRDLLEHLALGAFAEFLNASYEAENRRTENPAVLRFLNHVEDRFGDQDCLETAHHVAAISRNALIYKFKKEMRTTPARYLWKFRVERGVAMLAETGYTVAEISYHCGFKTPFHFSRLVKQHLGQSPKEIRRRAWSKTGDSKLS